MPRTTSRSEIVTWKKSASEQARGLDLDHIFVNLHTKLKQKMASDMRGIRLYDTWQYYGIFRLFSRIRPPEYFGYSPSRVQHPFFLDKSNSTIIKR